MINNLIKKARFGFKWALSSAVIQSIIQIVSMMVLARLLAPEDFGIYAAALTFVGILRIAAEVGIIPFIIQADQIDRKSLNTARTLSLILGIIGTTLLICSSHFIEEFLGIKGVGFVLNLMSVVVLISTISLVDQGVLQRELEFRTIAVAQILSYFVGYFLIASILAAKGFGVHSLVAGTLFQVLIFCFILRLKSSLKVALEFDMRSAFLILSFGFWHGLTKFLNQLTNQLDNIFLSKFFSAHVLGLYSRSYQLISVPAIAIGGALDKVIFPYFSHSRRIGECRERALIAALSITLMFVLPVSFLVASNSELIVLIMLGSNWLDAAPFLEILSILISVRILYKIPDAILKSERKLKTRLAIQASFFFVMFVTCYYAAVVSPLYIAYAVVISVFYFFLTSLYLACKSISAQFKVIFVEILLTATIWYVAFHLLTLIEKHFQYGELAALTVSLTLAVLTFSLLTFFVPRNRGYFLGLVIKGAPNDKGS